MIVILSTITRRLRALTALLAGVTVLSIDAPSAVAQSPYLYEAKFGVLAHDVPNLWSGFRLESGIDINGELI